jgi:hypothetical protein
MALLQTTFAFKNTKARKESVAPDVCPAELHSLFAGPLPHESSNFTRVLLADYPSTGSTWLKQLLTAVATSKKMGSPSCAIYNEGDCKLPGHVSCECNNFDSRRDAALIKTHFPAQELYNSAPLADNQYSSSMTYDRLVQLVRHPIASINSNIDRWGGALHTQSKNLQCWGQWWERVKDAADDDKKVLVLRYEDLCINTTAKVHEVLQHLGGNFASISLQDVNTSLAARPDLACIHTEDLQSQTQATPQNEFILDDLGELMGVWGYSTDKRTSEFPPPSTVVVAQVQRIVASNDKMVHNPWSSVWEVN